jgi:hypothetical protein
MEKHRFTNETFPKSITESILYIYTGSIIVKLPSVEIVGRSQI